MKWFLALGMVLALVGFALAADEVLLNDGAAVEGEIQAVDQNGITVVTDGKTLVLAPTDLDTHYYYEEWAKRVQNDAEGHLRVAVFAFENGMFNQARSHYRKAERLDKALVEKFETEVVPQIKEGVAENLLRLTRQAIKAEKWEDARRLSAKILTQLEDTKAAGEAREALASIQTWQLTKDQKRLVDSLTRYLPKDEAAALKTQEKVVKRLEPIAGRMSKNQDLVTKGLQTKSANRQKDTFKLAAKRYEDIIKDLDKLSAEASADEALAAYISETRATAVRDAIDAYIHAGGVYLIRRAYDDAVNMANAALALDPNSEPAKRFYQETLRGSQMRNGWWGRGGR